MIWVARDQAQPGSFSRERKEPGNEVEKKQIELELTPQSKKLHKNPIWVEWTDMHACDKEI